MDLTRTIFGCALVASLAAAVGCGPSPNGVPASTPVSAPTSPPRPTAHASAPERTVGPARAAWWVPPQGATWHIQYTGTIDVTHRVDVYNLDGEDTNRATVQTLRSRGVRTVCYINAGAWENWRLDKSAFPASVLGKAMDGWPGERWLDIRRLDVLMPIMKERMATCRDKGFDAVDADNVMGFQEDTGFRLTAADQLTYNRSLASAAHSLRLGFGLKNDVSQITQLLPVIDFATNEECVTWHECGAYSPLRRAGKAVFHIEYDGPLASVCASRPAWFSTQVKRLELGPERGACR